MRLKNFRLWNRHLAHSILVLILLGAAANAPTLTIRVSDVAASYGPVDKEPCPRGHAEDECSITGYLHANVVRSSAAQIYTEGWNAWNNAQPAGQRWTLVDGGDLAGEIEVNLFRTRNDCPGTAGVEVQAFFRPTTPGAVWWKWSQALHDNYLVGPAPAHDSTAPAPFFEMDVGTSGNENPPLYPYSYADGSFYDKPGTVCLHSQTVFFHAICLISTADSATRTLTTYRGFEYGFDYRCTHVPVPEPASMAAIGIGMIGWIRVRRSKSKGR